VGVRAFPGIHGFKGDTGFQPVRTALIFKMSRFANNNASSTGWKPCVTVEIHGIIHALDYVLKNAHAS
jgi:hypothetical protein